MSAALLHALAGVGLATLGLYGFVTLSHLLRRLLALNILGSGVFLILVGLAQRDGTVDPLPQALVLTGIVVAVAATALALVLIRRLYADTGATDLEHEAPSSRPSTTGADERSSAERGEERHADAEAGSAAGSPADSSVRGPRTPGS